MTLRHTIFIVYYGVEQNRTAIACLQSKYFTIKLQPRII